MNVTTLEESPAAPLVVAKPGARHRLWLTALWSLLTFVAGAVAGGAGATIYVQNQRHQGHSGGRHGPPTVEQVVADLRKDLSLTDDQLASIEPIVRRHLERFKEIHKEFDGERKQYDEEFSNLLTDAQREKWQAKRGRWKHGRR